MGSSMYKVEPPKPPDAEAFFGSGGGGTAKPKPPAGFVADPSKRRSEAEQNAVAAYLAKKGKGRKVNAEYQKYLDDYAALDPYAPDSLLQGSAAQQPQPHYLLEGGRGGAG